MPDDHDELTPDNELDSIMDEGMEILDRMDELGLCYMADLIKPIKSYQAKAGAIGMLVELRARMLKEQVRDSTTTTDMLVLLLNSIDFLERANKAIHEAIKGK